MSSIKKLVQSYKDHISTPWRIGEAAPQRVIFCVYKQTDELAIRLKLGEFKEATKKSEHEWEHFDLTDSFADWFTSQKYTENYFKNPELMKGLLPNYGDFIYEKFKGFCNNKSVGPNAVVAISGVGSLYKFVSIKATLERISPLVPGKLLIFFPGTCKNDRYKLLDREENWDYLAVKIP